MRKELEIAQEKKKQFEQSNDMLKQVNLLYLGTTVFILFDKSYDSRFWTLLEAWCAMQHLTPEGVRSETGVCGTASTKSSTSSREGRRLDSRRSLKPMSASEVELADMNPSRHFEAHRPSGL